MWHVRMSHSCASGTGCAAVVDVWSSQVVTLSRQLAQKLAHLCVTLNCDRRTWTLATCQSYSNYPFKVYSYKAAPLFHIIYAFRCCKFCPLSYDALILIFHLVAIETRLMRLPWLCNHTRGVTYRSRLAHMFVSCNVYILKCSPIWWAYYQKVVYEVSQDLLIWDPVLGKSR